MEKRSLPWALFGFLAVFLLIGGLAGGSWVWLNRQVDDPGPLVEKRDFVVPRGGMTVVAEALNQAGIIRSPLAFRIQAWRSYDQGSLHAAEFSFPPRVTLREVLTILRTARPVEHRLTIAEGLTARQIAALINKAEAATGELEPAPEGAVLPQTYAYEYGTPRPALLARAKLAMDKELAAAWAGRSPDLKLASPREVLILASIVERETAKPEERAHIAAVYINRLRAGMKLQADPTVAYAVSGGWGNPDHKLTKADLEKDDPFNTYRVTGLPPGPICSPGVASLRAAAHPAPSDDLYFVADGAGGHAFARTREAHERNVARWKALSN